LVKLGQFAADRISEKADASRNTAISNGPMRVAEPMAAAAQ
jgi:hypothetical protein